MITVLAGHLTSRVSSMGLVMELSPIDSLVIVRQTLGDRSGPRTEQEAQARVSKGQGCVWVTSSKAHQGLGGELKWSPEWWVPAQRPLLRLVRAIESRHNHPGTGEPV